MPNIQPRYSDKIKKEVMASLVATKMIGPVARAFGVSANTIRKWARENGIKLPTARKRMSMGAAGKTEERRKRWQRVRDLKSSGLTNKEIARAVGLKSQAAITHILRQAD